MLVTLTVMVQTPLGPNVPLDAPTLVPLIAPVSVSVLPAPVHITLGAVALVRFDG